MSRRCDLFAGAAAFSAAAAVYHVAGALGVLPSDQSSIERHLLFVVIDTVGAWYLMRRPPWLLPAFAVLVLQQTWSHGGRALRMWRETGRLDMLSVVVLMALYVALALVIREAYQRQVREWAARP